jgi:ribonuclease VapC
VILDSSVFVAIIRGEAEASAFVRAVESSGRVAVSASTLLETAIVLGAAHQPALDALLESASIEVVPFDHRQALIAREAYLTFGRGSDSPARLNFGDCFAYALATVRDEPLLFKGDDFTHTDVRPALPQG